MNQTSGSLLLIMALSSALQFLAAGMAIRLIRPSGAYTAWVLLACGFVIQGVRRIVSLVYVLNGQLHGDMTVEVLGLTISLLLFCGIWKFGPLFDEINGAQQALLEKQGKITKANHELEAFVTMVSHDLRAPMTIINGYAELLESKFSATLDKQAREYLQVITAEGSKMAALLANLLTLATVGYVERPERPVDANRVVDDVLVELADQLAAVGGTVRKRNLPAVNIPETLLAEIFSNLIANALRYACRAGGLIEIGGETAVGISRFYVRDHGPGIPQEERERIFVMFCRGSAGKTTEGTGVGLAIVQKIAQLYGGRAWVEETPMGGSTFWFEVSDR